METLPGARFSPRPAQMQEKPVDAIAAICVFCGSADGNRAVHRDGAARLGMLLAEAGVGLVFGGGRAGMMGAMADAALAAGGEVVGVIPRHLMELEHAHPEVTEMHVVDSMHSRKQKMFELADGFATLPGGIGTLDETFEIITWKQLGMHDKPIVVVNSDGYWEKLDGLIAATVDEGFASPETRTLYAMVPSVDEVLPALARMPAPLLRTDPARL